MKTKFRNSSETIHTFAQRTQNAGESSNIFFRNDTLYSYGYHFEICKFYESKKLGTVLLFTKRSYSNTTAKHISEARQATRQYKKVTCFYPSDLAQTKNSNFENTLVKSAIQAGLK